MESLGEEISWGLGKRQLEEKQSSWITHNRDDHQNVSLTSDVIRIKKLVQNRISHGKNDPGAVGEQGGQDTTSKAVAWAVFQHPRAGGVGRDGCSYARGMTSVRRPSRFKIEAQMKQLGETHRSVFEAVAVGRDDQASSSLFDSFELSSLLKTLNEAAKVDQTVHEASQYPSDDQTHGAQLERAMRYTRTEKFVKHGDGDAKDDNSLLVRWLHTPKSMINRRTHFGTLNDEMGATSHHHHNRWKSLSHTLHIDGINGLFHKFHAQVAPHDMEKTHWELHRDRISAHRKLINHRDHASHGDLNTSKVASQLSEDEVDGHHHHPHFWKFGLMAALTQPFCRAGHLVCGGEQPVIEHRHHHNHNHHHHVQRDGEDNEMTLQAISMRVAGASSFDETTTRRLSIEEPDGLRAPRNSLETPELWA